MAVMADDRVVVNEHIMRIKAEGLAKCSKTHICKIYQTWQEMVKGLTLTEMERNIFRYLHVYRGV